MSQARIYILGGAQSDFAYHWSRAGHTIYDILESSILKCLTHTQIPPEDVQSFHIGNFVGELFCAQGHLGGMVAHMHPAWMGVAAARHEAACASGSIAVLAACAEIAAGFYDVVCVAGVEQMRNVSGQRAADHLAVAAWTDREGQEAQFMWPWMFSQLVEVYQQRYGMNEEYLSEIARINIKNARLNPLAQTRNWQFPDGSFSRLDEFNPVIEGYVRKQDCSKITDGSAALMLASASYAQNYCNQRGISLDSVPYIAGWGHKTAPLDLASKLAYSQDHDYIFPHVHECIQNAFQRAEIPNVFSIDAIETHDCFTISEYMAIDHFGMTAPGDSWKAIESGLIDSTGKIPINMSGGLIGCGHPVGATGVRMLLDAGKQVTGSARDIQVEGAQKVATLNIGGSTSTCVSFVVAVNQADSWSDFA